MSRPVAPGGAKTEIDGVRSWNEEFQAILLMVWGKVNTNVCCMCIFFAYVCLLYVCLIIYYLSFHSIELSSHALTHFRAFGYSSNFGFIFSL